MSEKAEEIYRRVNVGHYDMHIEPARPVPRTEQWQLPRESAQPEPVSKVVVTCRAVNAVYAHSRVNYWVYFDIHGSETVHGSSEKEQFYFCTSKCDFVPGKQYVVKFEERGASVTI